MRWKNTAQRYGAPAKGFHWLIALLTLGLLPLGFFMVSLDISPFKLSLYSWHKSVGTLVLMLVALRLAWRLANRQPEEMAGHRPWERALAKIIHVLLYAGLFLMPLSGWLMSSAADFAHSFFGLFEMPDLVGKDERIFKTARAAHELGAYILLAAVGLHGLGAFKHHFLDRDETLLRMLPEIMPRLGTALAIFVFAGAATLLAAAQLLEEPAAQEQAGSAPAPVSIDDQASQTGGVAWAIVPADSRIGFSVAVSGKPFEGQFTGFDGDIIFDPAQLGQSRVDVSVDTALVQTGSGERDDYIRAPAWLDAAAFPQARFRSENFEKTGENRYIAHGELTLAGVTRPVAVPFTLTISEMPNGGQKAVMDASFIIDRLAFGIGENEWANPEMVAHNVTINVSLTATRQN